MINIRDLEKEIELIKQRNKRVEVDKAWETSWIRKVIIAVLTYIVVAVFFWFAGVTNPFINAIIPALAFILSTASLSFFKNLWLRCIYRR